MTETKTNWADIAYGLLNEHQLSPFGEMWPNLFQWRIGKVAYIEIAEQVAGSPVDPSICKYGPKFEAIYKENERRRTERLTSAQEAWGKEGGLLLGYPMVCDEEFEGLALEEIQ